MIWACSCANALSPVVFIKETLNWVGYRDLLRNNVLPFSDNLGNKKAAFTQDEAAPYRVGVTTKMLVVKNLKVFH